MKQVYWRRILKFSFISLFVIALSIPGISQVVKTNQELYGDEAKAIVPGANFVKMTAGSTVPSWVMFNDENKILFSEFFAWMKKSFELNSDYSFNQSKESTDDLGNTHHRYTVSYRGVLVDLNWLMVHEKNNYVYSFNGNVQKPGTVTILPALEEATALTDALALINAETYMWQLPAEEKDLKGRMNDESATYYPKGVLVLVENTTDVAKGYTLAWRFDIHTTNPKLSQQIYIDASTGEKIKSYALAYECDLGSVATTWYGTHNFNTDLNGSGKYILLEDCGGAQIHTTKTDGTDFLNNDNTWLAAGETGAATTHYLGRVTMDYYSFIHTRNSYNNGGGNLELRFIDDANAYWDGGGLIRIGNSNSTTDANFYNTLDVVAHEFTHGVTESEAALVYQGEPGGLNESFSDIFGETCEIWYEGKPSNQWDWLHREDYFNGANRSLIHPKDHGQPDTYLGTNWASTSGGDFGGVHTNSGVQNYWFYLLTVGGSGTNDNGDAYSVTGIGLTEARTIAFDNLADQLGVNSDYSAARTGAIAAATARYGACSNEVKQVTNAWHAVGVGAAYDDILVDLASFSNVSCFGLSNGSINISVVGSSPSYAWNDGPTTQHRTGLSAGTYTVTVTNGVTGCTATFSKTITQPDLLTASISKSNHNGYNISCSGGNDGWASVTPAGGTGPFTYVWNDPGAQTSATASGLYAGGYSVTVTDAHGCVATASTTLTEPPLLTAAITSVFNYNGYNISCFGGNNGWATVTAGGGVAPYTYLWSNAQSTATATSLYAIYYSVTVTDANGCTKTANITLTQPPQLTISAGPNQTVYYGYPPAQCATISWSGQGGGVPPYTYAWSDGGARSHQVCPGLISTVYTVTITDLNGCTATDAVRICVIDIRCGKKLDKVIVCHVPFDTPLNTQTCCVDISSVPTHLAHGDQLGACGIDRTCYDAGVKLASIESNDNETGFSVYPNPANDLCNIKLDQNADSYVTIEVTDLLGRKIASIYSGNLESGSHTFAWKIPTNGESMYFVSVRSSNDFKVIKLLTSQRW